ncbi:hypothetical protein G3435_25300 [Pseudomonas sp. MAFF212428]|uniref:Dermonecrotic toxin N-terminal domain-containing protein n=1 Tax=Pseudomonas brassicae TaxID=2708063 RepID=A0A6M0CY19_9PSED|nr:hypothetical protein [Pseudomonas brassicae]
MASAATSGSRPCCNTRDSRLRPTVEGHHLHVRQLLIQGSTVQGVLLITADENSLPSFVLYAPDAPDSRPWREYRNTRELLRSLRDKPALRSYVTRRLPAAQAAKTDSLLARGRIGAHVRRPLIEGDLFQAMYAAEVRALLADADAGSRSTEEANVHSVIEGFWQVLDLICLVLPNRALVPLAFGRAAIAIWDGLEALEHGDREALMRHSYSALSQLGRCLRQPRGLDADAARDAQPSAQGTAAAAQAPLGQGRQWHLALPRRRYLPGRRLRKALAVSGHLPVLRSRQAGRFYHITFDGRRWRVIDPDQPNAYLQLPLKRVPHGDWYVDSGVFWHDGCLTLRNCSMIAAAPRPCRASRYRAATACLTPTASSTCRPAAGNCRCAHTCSGSTTTC